MPIRYWAARGGRRSAFERVVRAVAEPDHLSGLSGRADVLAVDRHAHAAAVADEQPDALLGLPLLGLAGADDAAEQLLALGVADVEPARALGLDADRDVLGRHRRDGGAGRGRRLGGRGSGGALGRAGLVVPGRPPDDAVDGDEDERDDHGGAPVGRTPLAEADRGLGLERLPRRDRLRGPAVRVVVLTDERLGVDTADPRDAADVPARVEVSAAQRVVVALDGVDHGLADAGTAGHLGDGQACLLAGLREGVTDGHGASFVGTRTRGAVLNGSLAPLRHGASRNLMASFTCDVARLRPSLPR